MRKRLVNYTDGYQLDLPRDAEFDFSLPYYSKIKTRRTEMVISRERSSEDDVDYFIDHYMNRFVLNEEYREANRIHLIANETWNEKEWKVKLITVRLNDLPEPAPDQYTFVTLQNDSKYFYRIMIKSRAGEQRLQNDDTVDAVLRQLINSFRGFEPVGIPKADVDFYPTEPQQWSEETRQRYHMIRDSDNLRWGLYAEQIYEKGINVTVPALEKKLDHHFPVILSYIHFGTPFPTAFMQQCYEDNKMVELTFQTTDSNNEDLFGYTPQLDIYRGELDEEIRSFAREAKAFGHPFLFRLNNEMNSDWTSYSGIINLSDPEIYIANWRRFYRIFQEEGVDNAIWIFNPNDENYPPCNWNHFTAFYPGNEYVQMLGITGYNTGTYYEDVTGEHWRDFIDIYDTIDIAYHPYFSRFPWIITEFASSSYGGDKARWISEMFQRIKAYPNIKIAVWFHAADYDGEIAARPYFLDELPKTTAAFREGLKNTGTQDWKD